IHRDLYVALPITPIFHVSQLTINIATMRERTPFTAELIGRLPNLKLLLTTGNRNRGLDLDAFQTRGIPVAGAVDRNKSVGSASTAEHCVALILAAARNIAQDDFSIKTGGWQTVPTVALAGKVFGTVGLGRLGTAVAR